MQPSGTNTAISKNDSSNLAEVPNSSPQEEIVHSSASQSNPGAPLDDMTAAKPRPQTARHKALLTKKESLTAKLAELEKNLERQIESSTIRSELDLPSEIGSEEKTARVLAAAEAKVKERIELLHGYNEIKDIGLGMMGLVAEQRGVRQIEVMEEYGVTSKD